MSDSSLRKGRFTKFSNRIGLYSNQSGNYIANTPEVVLNFPFKDTVLEGGMTKEDAGRDERFLHLEIDKKDIDTLEDPKVLTNFKYIDQNGETDLTANSDIEFFDEDGNLTQNLLIKGNNLLALYSLREKLAGKVKLIYIDPPYNTGSDGFKYNDGFNHSAWLTFIKNRLEIAKELLSNDGIICISIDSSRSNSGSVVGTPELPYLNVLMDEVFGRKNYLGMLHWKKKKQPSFLSRIASIMECILVYAKEEENIKQIQLEEATDTTKRLDNASNKETERVIKSGIRFMGEKDYTIRAGRYQNKTMSTEFIDDVIIRNGRTQNSFRAIAKYRTSQTEIDRFCDLDLLYITANCSFRRFKTEEESKSGKAITDLLLDWGQNQDATDELRALFGITDNTKIFDNPKPERLLHNLIKSMTEEGDIVLDFCLGSGTTSAVAHKMNRRWIGIEQMDYIETVSKERLKKVINGEQGGISKDTDWQGGGSFVYLELKKYNQDFLDRLMEVTSIADVEAVYEDMQKSAFLKFFFDKREFEKDENFRAKTWEERRDMLVNILDENQLYLNLQDMRDIRHKVSNDEIALTERFYGVIEDGEN